MTEQKKMTRRAQKFVKELRELCQKHQISITPHRNTLQLWKLVDDEFDWSTVDDFITGLRK